MISTATVHYRSVIDALTAHVALLDDFGNIVAVNEGWRQFADENGSKLPDYGVGWSPATSFSPGLFSIRLIHFCLSSLA
jgi:hypothetical protein